MAALNGKWKLDRIENGEEFGKKLGMPSFFIIFYLFSFNLKQKLHFTFVISTFNLKIQAVNIKYLS